MLIMLSRIYTGTIDSLCNISTLDWLYKVLSLIFGFLSPLKVLFHLMFFFLLMNTFSGVYKSMVIRKEKFDTKKFRHVFEKLASYIIIMSMCYAFELTILGIDDIYITRIITGLIAMVEFKSTSENLENITGLKVFTTIYRRIEELFRKKTNDSQ